MKIGVFDSGVGGLSVAHAIEKALPDDDVIFRNDHDHVPYGSRDPEEIFGFIQPIFQGLIDDGCQVIVVACNTVSTTLIIPLREMFSVPLIAMEPMVKPAAEKTKSHVIAVCATPATLHSTRYAWLKETYAQGLTVLEPDCSDWSAMIESNSIDQKKIAVRINSVLDQKADVIVLGCTHYHWIESEIKEIANGRADVLQPEQPVIAQLRRVMQELERQT
jgi:glutamate racemase